MASFTAAERRRLAAELAAGREPVCPSCGTRLAPQDVQRPESVSYVRRRVWLLCPACRRTGAVDVKEAGRP